MGTPEMLPQVQQKKLTKGLERTPQNLAVAAEKRYVY